MSNDPDLARLFAEHPETLDGRAFTAKVTMRMRRWRILGHVAVAVLMVGAGIAAIALAPLITQAVGAAVTASTLLATNMSWTAAPFVWLGIGAVALVTAMCVRL